MMFITQEAIPLEKFLAENPDPSSGAQVFFVGRVRNENHAKSVKQVFYESYPSIAEKEIKKIVESVQSSFEACQIRLQHRVGLLEVGEVAVAIAANAPHRDEAFRACRMMIEELKQKIPIWKNEIYEDGTNEWLSGSCSSGREKFPVRRG